MHDNISNVSQIAYLVIQLGVIIFAAHLFGNIAKKIKIPSVLGEVIAGIVIGPYLLGSLNFGVPGFANGLFPLAAGSQIPVSMPLYGIAILGSIILLFMSGLETDLRMFFRYSLAGTMVGIGGMVFSFGFGVGLGVLMLDLPLMDPRALFLGILSTATSVGITARILSEKKSIDSPEGTTILAAAVIDDVLGIICLAIVMGIIGASDAENINWKNIELIALKSIGIWLGVTAVGLYFAHKIAYFMRSFHSAGVFSILAFAGALVLSGFFEQVGLAMIVGAYVTGLVLSKTDISFVIERSLRGVYDFLVPVFFVVMGMMVDVRVFGDFSVLKFGLLYTLLAILAKIIGCALPAWLLNFNFLGSMRIGMGMIPRGEVALIIAGIGATTMMRVNGTDVPVIDSKLFGIIIIMTLLTTLVAPPLLALTLSIKGSGVKKEDIDSTIVHLRYTFPDGMLADILLRELVKNFQRENYLHSEIHEAGIINFRCEEKAFALEFSPGILHFEVENNEVFMVKSIIRETMADLHHSISRLKLLGQDDRFSDLFSDSDLGNLSSTKKISDSFDVIVPPNCILLDFSANSYEDAIIKLVNVLEKQSAIQDPLLCINDILMNEQISSSCFLGGLALPHARTDGTTQLVSAIGICRTPVIFSVGGKTEMAIQVVVLSVCPRHTHDLYLQYISHVASKLSESDKIDKLVNCASPNDVRLFFRLERKI